MTLTKEEKSKEQKGRLIRLVIFILGLAIILTGCTSQTQFGDCIGLADAKKPDLVYKVSATNLIVAILTFELIAPPVIVAVNETFCPIGRKDGGQSERIPKQQQQPQYAFPGS